MSVRWETLVVVLGGMVLTYAARYGGFVLGSRRLPPLVLRFLGFVPVAVFAALFAPDAVTTPTDTAKRLIAATLAAVVLLRWRKFWLCLLVGMAGYWGLRFGI